LLLIDLDNLFSAEVRRQLNPSLQSRPYTTFGHISDELLAWKKKQAEELARLGVKANDDTFICGRSWDGGVVKPDSLTGEFRVAIREIPNFPIVRFHDLRHSHATQLLTQGIHPKIAQERLGHSTITTTLDLYSHVTDTMQNDAVEKLDSAFRSAIRAVPKRGPQLG